MAKRGDHEGSIFKRENGSWGGAIRVQSERKYVYAKTRRGVQEKLAQLQQDARAGIFQPKDVPKTVEEYLQFWLRDVVNVRPRTWEHYDLCVRRVLPYIGAIKLASLGPGDLVATWGHLKQRGLSNRTIKHCRTVLHAALEVAIEWRYVSSNPAKIAKSPRVERTEMLTLTSLQARRLFETTKGDRWHALWVLMVTTALRIGEVTALRWADLDLEHGRAVVQRTLQRQRGKGLVFVEPKSQSSVRSVLLTPAAIAALREHKVFVDEQQRSLGEAWQDLNLVFPALTGGPLDPSRVNSAFHTALHKSGLPRVRPHDLRHTSATLLLEAGVHPKVVQEMLGHSSIALTLGTYSHVMPRMHQEAASALQNVLFDAPRQKDVPTGTAKPQRPKGNNT